MTILLMYWAINVFVYNPYSFLFWGRICPRSKICLGCDLMYTQSVDTWISIILLYVYISTTGKLFQLNTLLFASMRNYLLPNHIGSSAKGRRPERNCTKYAKTERDARLLRSGRRMQRGEQNLMTTVYWRLLYFSSINCWCTYK